MYAEEAAYMDLGVFYNIVLPLFEMLVAVLIMISTPGIIRMYNLKLRASQHMEFPTRTDNASVARYW